MLKKIIPLTLMTLIFTFAAFGQDGPPANEERPGLLAQLGLLKEQVRQFRIVNAEHKPLMQEAQQRLRDANRELDMAIYADNVSDELFQAKLTAFQDAQNEVNRLRFMNELAIRKILTPAQLVRFREMRRRFAEARDRMLQQPRRVPQDRTGPTDQFRRQQRPSANDQPVRQVNRQSRPVN